MNSWMYNLELVLQKLVLLNLCFVLQTVKSIHVMQDPCVFFVVDWIAT